MSKRFIPVLLVLLILAGCSANNDLPQSTEKTFSSVSKLTEVRQDEKSTDEPCATETESIASSTETEVVAEPTENRETVSSESNQQKETVSEAVESQSVETSEQMPTQPKTETVETEKEPTNTQPVEQPEETVSQPIESETKVPEETEPAKPIESFGIDYWIDFARSYAQSNGLCLDETAVDCWDSPIRAGSHCIYLERDIQSRLNRYAKDEDITDVWIWFEPVGNDCYDIYIGYA